LSEEVRERPAVRLFRTPRIGGRVNCPHCGAPNAVTGMEELLAFVCSHCGNSVEVESPKVQ
jgi:transcription elongation factor Elf1